MTTYYSKDDETFNFNSFGEMIDDLRTDYEDEELVGMDYWTAEGRPLKYDDCIDVDRLLEDCDERAYDLIGESFDSDFYNAAKDGAKEELHALIAGWAEKHVKLTYWTLEGKSTKHVITQGDLE